MTSGRRRCARTVPTFAVTVSQSGLPAGHNWSVLVVGHSMRFSASTGSIVFALPNGTYTLRVSVKDNPGYSTQFNQVVVIAGSATSISVNFIPGRYVAWFDEKGLPPGTPWQVQIGNETVSGTSSVFQLRLPNGTYEFTVNATGYTATPGSGSFNIDGGSSKTKVQFSPASSAGPALTLDMRTGPSVSGSTAISSFSGKLPLVMLPAIVGVMARGRKDRRVRR
jgi:hypothetical protein